MFEAPDKVSPYTSQYWYFHYTDIYMNNNTGVKLGEQVGSLFYYPALSTRAPAPAAAATT